MPTFPLRLALVTAAAFLAASLPVHAELVWKDKTLEVKADPTKDVVEARFAFTNEGPKAVDIQQVESSCGCTTAELTERHYEPGAGGEIVARFTVGNHTGLQRKTVAVKSNDKPEPTILTLVTTIPEMLRMTPAFVSWAHGEEKKAKTVMLETTDEVVIKDIELQSSNGAMKAELEPVVKGHKYQITVTPGTTDRFVFSTLGINCRFANDIARTFRSYATVKPPSAGQ